MCRILLAMMIAISPQLGVAQRSEKQIRGAVAILLTPMIHNGQVVRGPNGELQYSMLLADHTNDRGHAPLGGTVEPGETARAAAARETAEESRFAFKESAVLQKLELAKPIVVGTVAFFVTVVDYINPDKIERAAFEGAGSNERMGFSWVPVDVVTQIVASEDRKISKQYRSRLARSDYLWTAFSDVYPLISGAIAKQIEKDRIEREQKSSVPRRLVTGRDESGKSVVKSFDVTPRIVHLDSAPGLVFYDQYATNATPSLSGEEPDPMLAKDLKGIHPNGTLFRMLTIPPTPKEAVATPAAYTTYLAEVDQKIPDLAGTFERDEPGMHTTDTLDYVVIIRGEILLELDKGKTVHLRPGDCVVQNGTRHRWINPGDQPCLMAAIMIGGKRNGAREDGAKGH